MNIPWIIKTLPGIYEGKFLQAILKVTDNMSLKGLRIIHKSSNNVLETPRLNLQINQRLSRNKKYETNGHYDGAGDSGFKSKQYY